jgi:hypothetical protein
MFNKDAYIDFYLLMFLLPSETFSPDRHTATQRISLREKKLHNMKFSQFFSFTITSFFIQPKKATEKFVARKKGEGNNFL